MEQRYSIFIAAVLHTLLFFSLELRRFAQGTRRELCSATQTMMTMLLQRRFSYDWRAANDVVVVLLFLHHRSINIGQGLVG